MRCPVRAMKKAVPIASKRVSAAFVIGLALVAQAGCVGETALPVERYYRIEAPPASAATISAAKPILLEPFDAYGVYAERALLYHEDGQAAVMRQYGHQFWAEPPQRMLDDALAATLRAALGPDRVHARASRERPEIVVRPRLRKLEQVYEGGGGARAVYAVDFTVTDRDGRPRFLLAFDESEPAQGQGPDTYVRALDVLVARANARLLERLAEEMK